MRVISLAPAVVLLAGCVEDLKAVRLKPDGSGTILYTRRIKDWLVEMLRENKLGNEFTEEKARERIKNLGEVEFVSVDKANVPGWEGMTATYSFKDVTKLKIDDSDTVFGREKLPDGNQKLTITSRFKSSTPDTGVARRCGFLDVTESSRSSGATPTSARPASSSSATTSAAKISRRSSRRRRSRTTPWPSARASTPLRRSWACKSALGFG